MMRKISPLFVAGLGLATFMAPSARAHIELIEPAARYTISGFDTGIKSCPCGLGGSNRVCNVAQDGSDPDRSPNVTRVEAGSTLTLRFEEFVDHAGRFRVAFDPEGADMADFNQHILADIPDPSGTGGQVWEIPVTIPEETCSNCTLQLVQAMEVPTDVPISDPGPISSYYSCVDLEIVPRGTLSGEGTDDGQPADEGSPDEGQPTDEGQAPPETPNEQPPSDAPAGPETTPPANPSSGAAPDGSGSGNAGTMTGTPLIPAGSGTPMDTGSSATGSAATGSVAMNGPGMAPAAGAPASNLPAPPAFDGSSSSESSSGGCSLSAGSSSGASIGVGALGVLALAALRRRARRAK